jgi:hypothetical protein
MIAVTACNKSTSPIEGAGVVFNTFTVADTMGRSITQFHSGEEFDFSFSATNETADTLTYHSGYPIIGFIILKADSVVTSSYDGCAFPQIVI